MNDMDYELGIDVSRWQNAPITNSAGQIIGYKPLNYAKAKAAGVTFAGVRATVGDYYTDPCFEMNYQGFMEQEIDTNPYLVVAPADGQGRKITAERHVAEYLESANELIAAVPQIQIAPIVLDCELDRGQTAATITAPPRCI